MRIVPAVVTAAVVTLASPQLATAASAPASALTPYNASLHDKHSLQRGARLFVNYCVSCHSAQFMRYSRMAEDLEIPPELVERHMMFTTDKIGEPMVAAMRASDAAEWFGIAPPDLSLIARLRGGEWLYNFFLSFYLDANAPSGWNNTVYPNLAMPHALHTLQGLRRAAGENADGSVRFIKVRGGDMSDEEYARAAADLTNFLVYVGEPSRPARLRYGLWVMFFLLVFMALAHRLKKEYWRDVESHPAKPTASGD